MIETALEPDGGPQHAKSRAGLRGRLPESSGRSAEIITQQWLAQLLQPMRPTTDAEPPLTRATSHSSLGPTAPPHAPYSPKRSSNVIGASTMKPTPAQGALP